MYKTLIQNPAIWIYTRIHRHTYPNVQCHARPKKGMKPCCPPPYLGTADSSVSTVAPLSDPDHLVAPMDTRSRSAQTSWGCHLEDGFLDNMQEEDFMSSTLHRICRKRWDILSRELNEHVWRLPPPYVCLSVRKWGGHDTGRSVHTPPTQRSKKSRNYCVAQQRF